MPRRAALHRHRRLAAVGLALASIVALAGCVGIPTSSGVQSGPVIDDQADPEIVVLPTGPRAGATQEEILADFMQAVRAPQAGYAIARQFLTSELSGTWDPDASALLRTGAATTSPSSAADALDYTITTTASVDASGRYTEQTPATQTLQFSFTEENGEWRIGAAPDGIVLSLSSFNVVFTEQALYFFDPSYGYLVPDVRWFPARATVEVRIVDALLAGPTDRMQQVVTSAFPVATMRGSIADTVQVESGTVTIDLSREALSASAEDRERMRQQLLATLGPALNISTVVMTVGGLALETPDSTGVGAAVNPAVDSAVLAGVGGEFGFVSETAVTPIDSVSEQVVAVGGSAATLSGDTSVAAVLGADGNAYVAGTESPAPLLVDDRDGLAQPTIDPFRFVWSAQAASAATLSTFELDGTEHPLQSDLPADARIVSLDLSRDGTRLLLYLDTASGPELWVVGIIRRDGIPAALGEPLVLIAPDGDQIDSTWIDDRTVATASGTGAAVEVTVFRLGGPSSAIGLIQDALTIVGGNGGIDGLRVLRASGEVWRPQGSGGWVDTGITASFLGTKQ